MTTCNYHVPIATDRDLFLVLEELRKLQIWHSSYDAYLFSLPQKKLNTFPSRVSLFKNLFLYLAEENELEDQDERSTLKIPFVLEMVLCVQYYHNQILDRKAGVINKEQRMRNALAASELKALIYRYIDTEFPPAEAKTVKHYVSLIFFYTDIGQLIEIQFNRIKAKDSKIPIVDLEAFINNLSIVDLEAFINNYLCLEHLAEVSANNDFDSGYCEKVLADNMIEGFEKYDYGKLLLAGYANFGEQIGSYLGITKKLISRNALTLENSIYSALLSLYYQRISLTSGALYYFGLQILFDINNIKRERRRSLNQFIRLYTFVRQIVNDNADCLLTQFGEATCAKFASDAFSDLKNKNLTLPLILHLKFRPHGEIANFIRKRNSSATDEHQQRFYDELLSCHSIFYSMTIGKSICDKALTYLDSRNSIYGRLAYLVDIGKNNRFYKYFYGDRHYRGYKKAKKIAKIMASLPYPIRREDFSIVTW